MRSIERQRKVDQPESDASQNEGFEPKAWLVKRALQWYMCERHLESITEDYI